MKLIFVLFCGCGWTRGRQTSRSRGHTRRHRKKASILLAQTYPIFARRRRWRLRPRSLSEKKAGGLSLSLSIQVVLLSERRKVFQSQTYLERDSKSGFVEERDLEDFWHLWSSVWGEKERAGLWTLAEWSWHLWRALICHGGSCKSAVLFISSGCQELKRSHNRFVEKDLICKVRQKTS